jgi:hypothetical protein
MVKNTASKMALSCHKLGGGYKSPEIKTVIFQPEGVVCASVFGLEHQSFTFDEVEDL